MQSNISKANTKHRIFVLMPFHSDFNDIYQVGIKAACLSVGVDCERVDEQIFVENILERVYGQIAKADIVISEMTGRNPNVFYETGYAHALGKRVILLTQNADDIPFDLKHYPHIVYGGKISYLKSELEKRIKWCIDNPAESMTNWDLDVEFTINGEIWHENLKIQEPYEILTDHTTLYGKADPEAAFPIDFFLRIAVHNISKTVIKNSDYHLRVIIPKVLLADTSSSDIDALVPTGQHKIIRLKSLGDLFPDDWNSVTIPLRIERKDYLFQHELIIRLFSELGTKDYKFEIDFFPKRSSA